jgi:hypothetical protein
MNDFEKREASSGELASLFLWRSELVGMVECQALRLPSLGDVLRVTG